VLQENAQIDNSGESLQNLNKSSWNFIKQSGGETLIITRNAMGADLFIADQPIHFPAPPVKVTNTIGAGDAFNAGIAYQLHKNNIPQTEAEWGRVVKRGLEFAEKHLK
jgi:sugar/nucleoside kinase (ribokinase family)